MAVVAVNPVAAKAEADPVNPVEAPEEVQGAAGPVEGARWGSR
ncbi:hypothetical protein J25TS5_52390 [Paenibacillus faecis]|nr:hypothetical protein J25TS5_52390 [Paenibacillus faecis]